MDARRVGVGSDGVEIELDVFVGVLPVDKREVDGSLQVVADNAADVLGRGGEDDFRVQALFPRDPIGELDAFERMAVGAVVDGEDRGLGLRRARARVPEPQALPMTNRVFGR